MSDLYLSPMPAPGSGNIVNGVHEGTPVFIYYEPNIVNGIPANRANELFIKKALGMFIIEKENVDVLQWLESQGKDIRYLRDKVDEMIQFNDDVVNLVLKMLHKLTWKKLPDNNDWTDPTVADAQLGTIDANKAFKLLQPAYKSIMEIYATLLEEKYPSKLVATGLRHAVEHQKLEVSQKTGKLIK